jgi:predicted glycosyltransferase
VVNVLFYSHDGYGLGHVRRNSLIADALLDADPSNQVTIVTGVAKRPRWISDGRIAVVGVPPLLKDRDGAYRNPGMTFEQAIRDRALAFRAAVERTRPDVVVVDRHPYGTGGELLLGLTLAKDQGARLVLGLRDVIDEPAAVRAELAGEGWRDVANIFDEILVYGEQSLCDQEAEYGLPMRPTYCGWVSPPTVRARPTRARLVISAGGGGDGDAVYALGLRALQLRPTWQGCVVAGPYAANVPTGLVRDRRISIVRNATDCIDELSQASASLQMAGYNSTVEAIACGLRPILVPRRSPRREQAIRALRLSALGLADTVDEQADPSEVAWLLDRPRLLAPQAAADAGIRLDGAQRAARHIQRALRVVPHRRPVLVP